MMIWARPYPIEPMVGSAPASSKIELRKARMAFWPLVRVRMVGRVRMGLALRLKV